MAFLCRLDAVAGPVAGAGDGPTDHNAKPHVIQITSSGTPLLHHAETWGGVAQMVWFILGAAALVLIVVFTPQRRK